MARNKDKEWQGALENLEKKVMDGMEEYFERMMKRLEEREEKAKRERLQADEKMKQDIKDIIATELGDIKKELGTIKQEMSKNIETVQKLEEVTKELEIKTKELTMADEKLSIMVEALSMDKQLRIRGLPEEKGENIYKKVAGIFSEFMEEQEEAMEDELDLVYRVNSTFAERKNIPRDVVVQFVTSRTKEDILRQQFKNPVEVDEKKILILKETPKKALILRKKYKRLTEILTKQNIRFRWELPEGLTFKYKGTRQMIKTEEQMERFIETNKFEEQK